MPAEVKARLAAITPLTQEEREARARARITRLNHAKAEAARLKRWTERGEKGPRPATPNLDVLADLTARGVRGSARLPKVGRR